MHDLSTKTDRNPQIAILNDAFRITFLGGSICVTAGLALLGDEFVAAALLAVRDFRAFTPGDDPHGEHDFGSFAVEGRELMWFIEYFDPTMLHGSDDPARVDLTRRVLTVMLAEEY